jgi:Tfp pilus assembly protein PilE
MKMNTRQRGFSLLGMLFVGGVIAVLALVGMQVAPGVIEFLTIQKTVKKIASAGTTVPEIKAAFDRFAQIDSITSITGQDLEITKAGEKIVVSFAYNKEVHLAGPAYLLMKYKGSSR